MIDELVARISCHGYIFWTDDEFAVLVLGGPRYCRVSAARMRYSFFPTKWLRFIDHYNKYGIAPEFRRPGDELLWIGGFQYFPYVYCYVLENHLHDLKINYLTDFRRGLSRGIAATMEPR